MDPTPRFFAKLKTLAVTLESETAKLQHSFENRHNGDGDPDATSRGMRTYHELNSDVSNLKGLIQDQLAEQKARESEVGNFIAACRVMEQKVSKNIQTLKAHWEKYGYQAPQAPQRTVGQEPGAADEAAGEPESAVGGEVSQEGVGGNQPPSPPVAGRPTCPDVMRTPQLSDFGLSEVQFKRALAGAGWCAEVPPMPQISLPQAGLSTPAPPRMPITPKCALRMDDDDLQTPKIHDFGISEHTRCLINDFTMDLQDLPRTSQVDKSVLPKKSSVGSFQAKGQEPGAADEPESAVGGEVSREGVGGNQPPSPPVAGRPTCPDVMRTPQLSDFGLSEVQFKRALAGAGWCAEVPPMPQISLPQAGLSTPAPPRMPITPKCALRMDDDDLQTSQVHDFGISEHTRCLINDFTMDLLQKNIEKPPRTSQVDRSALPMKSLMESLQAKDSLESPELPELCTPGLKIKKTKSQMPLPEQGDGEPESSSPGKLLSTPEVPAFKSGFLNQLVWSTKAEDHSQTFELPTPQKMQKMSSEHACEQLMPPAHSLALDGPTQEFSLGTPRLRRGFQEPSTPEMPDLSSVTQDICKLVSQAQLKKNAMAVVQPNVRPVKDQNRVSVVSESEFQTLPSYLRQMTLHNLNQAIHNINQFVAEDQGRKTEFCQEELRRITSIGTKTPLYILCLTELKRLTHVGGAKKTSVYKLSTHC